jgi:TPR repeat protein
MMKKSKNTTSAVSAGLKSEARKLLEEACDLFESGERSKSIKLFLRAAKEGSCEAQVNIANIYDEGGGVKVSFDKARYWYKRAIAGGSPEAAYNLGISYLNRGNVRWARHWLHVAKSMGDEDAEEKLSQLDG